MKRLFATLILLATLTGCSTLIPKRVELGQDKVQKMPVPTAAERETQRQAARAAAEASEKTLSVVNKLEVDEAKEPAKDAAILSRAVTDSLGPPKSKSSLTSEELSARLERTVAKLNERLEEFRKDNDKNVGHKIEGTGWLSVPYFIWTGGALLLAFLGFIVLKVFLTVAAAGNPAVGLGLTAVNLGGRGAAALASQVLKGGQLFRQALAKEAPEIRERVEKLFVDSHKQAQSPEIQEVVRKLIS